MSRLLNTFLNIEINDTVINVILNAVRKVKEENIESLELTFNIYSLVIDAKRNEVLLSNDIAVEEPAEVIELEHFCKAIMQFRK